MSVFLIWWNSCVWKSRCWLSVWQYCCTVSRGKKVNRHRVLKVTRPSWENCPCDIWKGEPLCLRDGRMVTTVADSQCRHFALRIVELWLRCSPARLYRLGADPSCIMPLNPVCWNRSQSDHKQEYLWPLWSSENCPHPPEMWDKLHHRWKLQLLFPAWKYMILNSYRKGEKNLASTSIIIWINLHAKHIQFHQFPIFPAKNIVHELLTFPQTQPCIIRLKSVFLPPALMDNTDLTMNRRETKCHNCCKTDLKHIYTVMCSNHVQIIILKPTISAFHFNRKILIFGIRPDADYSKLDMPCRWSLSSYNALQLSRQMLRIKV